MNYKVKDFSKEISVISKIEGLKFQEISIDNIPGDANITKQNKDFQISVVGFPKCRTVVNSNLLNLKF